MVRVAIAMVHSATFLACAVRLLPWPFSDTIVELHGTYEASAATGHHSLHHVQHLPSSRAACTG